MKKWIAVVLALVLTLSVTACGGKEPSVSGKVEPSSAETYATKQSVLNALPVRASLKE